MTTKKPQAKKKIKLVLSILNLPYTSVEFLTNKQAKYSVVTVKTDSRNAFSKLKDWKEELLHRLEQALGTDIELCISFVMPGFRDSVAIRRD
jgi:hypothetical protein